MHDRLLAVPLLLWMGGGGGGGGGRSGIAGSKAVYLCTIQYPQVSCSSVACFPAGLVSWDRNGTTLLMLSS